MTINVKNYIYGHNCISFCAMYYDTFIFWVVFFFFWSWCILLLQTSQLCFECCVYLFFSCSSLFLQRVALAPRLLGATVASASTLNLVSWFIFHHHSYNLYCSVSIGFLLDSKKEGHNMTKKCVFEKMVLQKNRGSVYSDDQKAKTNRFLITINILGSAGPIRFVVNEEKLVSGVIDTALKSYAREGRLPVLGFDASNFLLYRANAGFDGIIAYPFG